MTKFESRQTGGHFGAKSAERTTRRGSSSYGKGGELPDDWQPLRTTEAGKRAVGAYWWCTSPRRLGVRRQRDFHGRDCYSVQHRVFLDGPARGSDTYQWFRAPDAPSARAGGAVPCSTAVTS